MKVDLINLSIDSLKLGALKGTSLENGIKLSVPIDRLVFKPIDHKTVILKEAGSDGGVVLGKVELSSLLPQNLNLTRFRASNPETFQIKSEYEEQALDELISSFNEGKNIPLLGKDIDVLKHPTAFEPELVKDFLLFCKIYGFWVLDISDISLSKVENILTIRVVETHPSIRGYVEVNV